MGNLFPEFVGFRKKWRPSQIQALERLAEGIADGRFHLSAAPGSGKTSLGLEILRRLDQPALVLSPTTAGSERWKSRFKEDFLPEEEEARKWVSRDASVAAPIISVTYQSMYSAFNVRRPFIKWMKNAGVKVLCLDEPHHLRNEWWRALEQLTGELPGLKIVSLTVVPPYDATEVEWQRCVSLCGEADQEIRAPWLVREGVLCPYQDYLYFCRPGEEETEQIREQRREGMECLAALLHDAELREAAKTHLSLAAPEAYEEFFLKDPEYFLAFLAFLKENRIEIPEKLLGISKGNVTSAKEAGSGGGAGTKEAALAVLPPMTEARMETFLRGFLTYDRDSYEGAGDYQAKLEEELKEKKGIVRGKINLTRTMEVRRLLNAGKEKLAAVEQIVRTEWDNLGEDLHMLILTDHIKKEQMPVIGDEAKPLKDIGTVPVFEALRRARIEGLYLMVMTGTLMMIPDYLVPWFEEHTQLKWAAVKETGYSRLQFTTDCQAEAVKWMTAMFEEGYANVLIGSASLLGEDWECPCLNTLVLATRIGSYMQAGQMRGKVMRADPANPDKTANIWHVVTLDPDAGLAPLPDFLRMLRGRVRAQAGPAEAFAGLEGISEDCEQVMRRFFTFQGLSREGAFFENGPERRIDPRIGDGFSREEEINETTLAESRGREAIRRRWKEALAGLSEESRVREEVVLTKREFPASLRRRKVLTGLRISYIGEVLFIVEGAGTKWLGRLLGPIPGLLIAAAGMIVFMILIYRFRKILREELTPEGRIRGIAHGVREALQDKEQILSPGADFAVEHPDGGDWHIFLAGGTKKEERLFADCMAEYLGPVEDPRYLLVEARADGGKNYYPVPEPFGRNKRDANLFYRNMKEYQGDVILGYTESNLGRDLLLRARFCSRETKEQSFARRKQVVKG